MALTALGHKPATILATSTNRTLTKADLYCSGILMNTGQVAGNGACYVTITRTAGASSVTTIVDDSEVEDTICLTVGAQFRIQGCVTAVGLDTGAAGTATLAWIPDGMKDA